jgi:hypothetical protein
LLLIDVWQRRADAAAIVVAAAGAWLIWSSYASVARVAWFYDRLEHVRKLNAGGLPPPDYELNTLPWQTASPHRFELKASLLMLVTNPEPYAYQAFATVETRRASSADIQFDAEVESGGASIGLLQNGNWIAVNSSTRPGRFADANTAELGRGRSVTVVVANNNAAGESRLTIRTLRLYLRR